MYHKPIVGPTAKLHHTFLLIKRKELNVNTAVGFVNGRRVPPNLPVVVENCLRHDRHFVVPISTKNFYQTFGKVENLIIDNIMKFWKTWNDLNLNKFGTSFVMASFFKEIFVFRVH